MVGVGGTGNQGRKTAITTLHDSWGQSRWLRQKEEPLNKRGDASYCWDRDPTPGGCAGKRVWAKKKIAEKTSIQRD